MIHFVEPNTLRQRFAVYGHFYRIRMGNSTLPCRSVLEIVDREHAPTDPNELLSQQPEYVSFLMNPGSSHPYGGRNYGGPLLRSNQILAKACLIPTYPDAVQYQIMRLMICLGTRHTRVLNLFDLREPDSAAAASNLISHSSSMTPAYSVLSASRSVELRCRVNSTNTSVIVGWGENRAIEGLATACMQKLRRQQFRAVGQRITGTDFFSYPRARGASKACLMQWICDIAVDLRPDPHTEAESN